MRRAVLIVNPGASAVTDDRLAAVEVELRRHLAVETVRTERPGHAAELAAEARGLDALIVFSGDGGFNEALNGLAQDVPVGFVPGGRTNVLPRALGLPRDAARAAAAVGSAAASGRTRRISLGRVNGRRFAFAAGIGLDGELVRRLEERRTSAGLSAGNLELVYSAARLLLEHRSTFPPVLEVAGGGRAAFALVANCDPYTYLGRIPLHAAPEARFELGLDLVAPAAVGPRTLPRVLAYALLGRGQTRAADVLYRHDVDRVEVLCDGPLPMQADGEDLGDVTEAVFESERGAVRVLT
jgi:diacylglycerol kinase family enzyme